MYRNTTVTLSARERAIIAGLAEGAGMAQIATRLGISPHTVKTYLDYARVKLKARAASALVHAAYRTGTLPAPLPDPAEQRPDLTPTQQAIVDLIATGMPTTLMAGELGRPLGDIRREVRRLEAQFTARTLAHLVTRAWQTGHLGHEVSAVGRSTRGSHAPCASEESSRA